MKIRANNIEIEVEDSHPGGIDGRPVVLLIMGLGMQLSSWPSDFVQGLVDAGYRVVRFDNRDIGLSQGFDALGVPNLLWQGFKFRLGMTITPPYTLTDMAADTVGVLEALEIDKAHVVGVSMGGMIAQRVALLAPSRLLSLSSIMSSSGARGLPEPKAAVVRVMVSRPREGQAAAIEHTSRLFRVIGSPGFPSTDLEIRERVAAGVRRSYHPQGIVRQMVATVSDTTRADELSRISAPTLVIHGRADPLVPFGCGEDTARRIPGARLVGIDGMGHDLPPGVVQHLLPLLVAHFRGTAPAAASPAPGA
jgi:pimeloyl-ACP methyl ester carboxylesterase